MTDYDVVIAGAGMVGSCLAIALARETHARIAVIERHASGMERHPSFDDRGITLSESSRRIFQALDLWNGQVAEQASPIRHVHVSDRGRPGFVRIDAREVGYDTLGYVVTARELGMAMLKKLGSEKSIEMLCPAEVRNLASRPGSVRISLAEADGTRTLSAKLVVAADGSDSAIRRLLGIPVEEKDYGQTAIIANVTVEYPHPQTAFERFTNSGPLALLPLGENRYVMVLTVASRDAGDTLGSSDATLAAQLQEYTGGRLGRFLRIGKRHAYPLKLMQPLSQGKDRVILLGNSAHTIHPNGAQGLNLCLRDMAQLAELLCGQLQEGNDPGSPRILDQYLQARIPDQKRVIGFSDFLPWLFYNENPLKVVLRNSGMILMDLMPFMKQAFVLRAIGIHGGQPAMVRNRIG